MASFVFFIVTTFQIWACHVTCVYKLAKNFISRDTLLNFRKRLKIFVGGPKRPPLGWNSVKRNKIIVKTSFNYCSSGSGQSSVIRVVCNVPE